MKNQASFSTKDKSKNIKIKCRLLLFLFGALRVKRACSKAPQLKFSNSSILASHLKVFNISI